MGMARQLRVGDKVKVPWGLQREVDGEIVEIWGDPPQHVRVQLELAQDDDVEPVTLLLAPSVLTAA